MIAEAYTDAAGIATYSYTQYAAGTDAVAVYPTGAPTTRATANVFWGVSDILTVTESATGAAVNGTTRTYTVTLKNPANNVAMPGAVVNVTLLENVGANGTNAVVADPNTGRPAVTPYQTATSEVPFTVTTNSNGQATFTLTGANTTATPVVFIDSAVGAGISGNANSRLDSFELQVKMPAVVFAGAQAGYTFDFSPMVNAEFATGVGNEREYKAVVKKADGTVYANGAVMLALNEVIDNVLTTSTTAVLTNSAGTVNFGQGNPGRAYTTDANGIVTFYVAELNGNTNVTATPAIWIDLDRAGATNGIREAGEPQALAPTTTFQQQVALGSDLTINRTPLAVKAGPFVTGDVINATFQIRNQSNELSQTAGFNRVTYTITNTSGGTVTFTPALTDGAADYVNRSTTFATGSTTNIVDGAAFAPITLNAGSSVTIAGTAPAFTTVTVPETSTSNQAVLSFTAGAQDNTFSISATGTTVRRLTTSDARNVGSVSQAAKSFEIKNATQAAGTITGEIIGYSVANVADGTTDLGRLVVKLDGSGSVVYMNYGTNRTGNISAENVFMGTDGTFAFPNTNFNRIFNGTIPTAETVATQQTAYDRFENALEIGNRVNSTVGSTIYLANVKGASKTIAENNLLPSVPVVVSNDASLTALTATVGGNALTFNEALNLPTVLAYTCELPVGTVINPVVAATATNPAATVVITQPTTATGLATIKVTAQDNVTVRTYTVQFQAGVAPVASVTAISVHEGTAVTTARSTEVGDIYLVADGTAVTTKAGLEALVTAGTATTAQVIAANTNTTIATTGLTVEGLYSVYAVDIAGNVSVASTNKVTIDNTAPAAPVFGLLSITDEASGTPDTLTGANGAVENNATVKIYSNAALTIQVGGNITATAAGAFGPANLTDINVGPSLSYYVVAVDAAGNVSAPTGISYLPAL